MLDVCHSMFLALIFFLIKEVFRPRECTQPSSYKVFSLSTDYNRTNKRTPKSRENQKQILLLLITYRVIVNDYPGDLFG
jgi:hypothetical protein